MSQELVEAFANIVPIPEVKIEYRLYYDTKGKPITMSSHNHPEGNYIVITKQQYDYPNYNCRVVDGKLQFDLGNQFHVQLKKSASGVPVVRGHANLVADEEYPEIEYYDRIS